MSLRSLKRVTERSPELTPARELAEAQPGAPGFPAPGRTAELLRPAPAAGPPRPPRAGALRLRRRELLW